MVVETITSINLFYGICSVAITEILGYCLRQTVVIYWFFFFGIT